MKNSPSRRVRCVASLAGRSFRLALVPSLILALACSDMNKQPTGPGQPPVLPLTPAPSVNAVTPNIGATTGGTPAWIIGTGVKTGALVQLGGATAYGRTDWRDTAGTILYFEAPAHAAGTVDVVVTNPGGSPGTLAGAYTYAPPEAFDFNGEWSGFGNAGQDIPIIFTIRNNVLVSVSCDAYATLTFSDPPAVVNGEFSYAGTDGVAVSGRIVGQYAAVGTLNLAPCTDTNWGAAKMEGGAAATRQRASRGTTGSR